MKHFTGRDKLWLALTVLCFTAMMIVSFAPGIPNQWEARKRAYGFFGVLGAVLVGYMVADRLELLPRAVPRKCPKCGVKLKNFKKNYSTGEVTCGSCGRSFTMKKGRVLREPDSPG